MNHNLKTKTTNSIQWTILNTIFSTTIQFIQLAILGRLLSPTDFGLMAMVMLVTEFAMIFSQMGLSEAIISKASYTRKQLSSLYWINIVAGIILYCILTVFSSPIAFFFDEARLIPMIPVVALIFIISSLSIQFDALLRKHLMFDIFTKINIIALITGFIISIGFALKDYGVWSLVYGQLGFHGIRTIFLFFVAVKKKWLPLFHFNYNEINEHFIFGLHRVGAMAINQLNSRIDQLVIGSLLGPIALGYYNMAFRIVLQPIQQINPILTQVAFPVFSLIQDDNKQLKSAFLKMIRLLISVNAPLLIGISAVAPVAIPLLLGPQWNPSVPVVQILAFYALIRSLGNAGGSLILAKGKASWTLFWNVALMFFIPATVYIAVTVKQTITIVAIALVILQIILVFLHYFTLLKPLIGSFLLNYLISIGKPFFAASLMGISVYFLMPLILSNHPIYQLSFSVIVGVLLYIILSLIVQRALFLEYWDIVPETIQNKLKRICKMIL